MTAYERLLDTLTQRGHAVRSNGHTKATAQCPAHDDTNPSLSITGIEGQTLIYCQAGCQTPDVLNALNLTLTDLFDTPKGTDYTYDNGRAVHRTPDKKFHQRFTENPPELYRVTKVKAAVASGRAVYVVEGEKDVHALEEEGATATCCPMGAGKWSKIDPSPLYGGRIFVIADQDPPGLAHAADILASLKGRADVVLYAPKVGKDASDHIAAGYGPADFIPLNPPAVKPRLNGHRPVTITLSDVKPERVHWLWPGRLPLGKLVVLDGDPSVGKSTLAVDWAARISTGGLWPDHTPCPPGDVLLLSAEDGLADTIRPRLDAAEGDSDHVHALTEIEYLDEKGDTQTRPVTLADLDDIAAEIRRTCSRLVIIDVLMAYLPGKVDAHRDQDIRVVLSGLAAVAERTGCCILLLRHLNKSGGGSAMYRGGGSIGIIGAARLGLLAATDPDDSNRRVLAATKSNLAAMPDALAYRLLHTPEHDCARVEWLGVVERTADALVSGPKDEGERTDRDDAADWLLNYLGDVFEAPSKEIKKAARAEGIAEATLKRAKAKAGVRHYLTKTKPPESFWTHPDFASGLTDEAEANRNLSPRRFLNGSTAPISDPVSQLGNE